MRTPGPGPRGAARRTPGGAGAGRAGGRPGAGPGPRRGASRPRVPAQRRSAPRPRFTGRAAILVLVVALLMVSYASSMRAYLEQRRHLASLGASIASSQAEVDRLTREKQRWDDPAYVRTIAHQRFGWVLPGEIGFQVLDDNGRPLDHQDTLSPQDSVTEASRPLWWQSAWGSVVTAGKEQAQHAVPPPAAKIQAPARPTPTDGTGR